MSSRICVIGTGYVGLVSGVCFADLGFKVTCVDKDVHKIHALNNGIIPIYEPGLEEIALKNINKKRLAFATPAAEHIAQADYVLIAVGTPTSAVSGAADLSYVYDAAREIAENLSGYTLVITKSTVPVGTGDEIEAIFNNHSTGEFDIVSNPEFLREGSAIQDFLEPDRIVIGCNNEKSSKAIAELYRPFIQKNTPIIFCNRRTSELTKYASNAFLATKISFINEIADLCERVGADISKVAEGMGYDGRIGSSYLRAGPGYGGSCLPKDTRALSSTSSDFGNSLKIVEAVIEVNSKRKKQMAKKVLNSVQAPFSERSFGILGLAFKPNTDDIRESPSIDIIDELVQKGANVRVFDPEAMNEFKLLFPDITYCKDAYNCAEGVDSLVIVTEWKIFHALDFEMLGDLMNSKVLLDLRNIYDSANVERFGFKYSSIGKNLKT